MTKLRTAIVDALVKGPEYQIPQDVDKENIDKNLINKTWDDMNRMYDELAAMLANNSESFKTLMELSLYELKDYISSDEKTEIGILYKGYVRDLDTICAEALKIKRSYEHFTGAYKDENETLMSISVLESYISIHDKIMAIFPPMSVRLAEIVGEAARKRTEGLKNG